MSPLGGSTNYMGAYNAQGQLRRVVEAAAEKDEERKRAEKKNPSRASSTNPAEERDGDESNSGKIPPETLRDLRPFPLNPAFLSQPVLSDDMREEIWRRIMTEGKSVREVSAELAVEMSRVGAVVRLKEIEKEWLRIVSSVIPDCPFPTTPL